ncbi:MAG: electron transfer flavoprotein subunit beta/FixA family protein [Candidatus Eremiobacteraeota bacterium]|nr:electron transfer flavoprotein subunit beta/FixA family protein [Candidatus Eremiobacteraeota bacterium]MBV8332956.1 electron transfer flavoprotein subunit beta/FixA family protein [Candidatus Eremiobacteraeota bacterium]MBV8435337.1 electron transfer flavoprotein subunit beta/FixA family protein [Candidatus Eremiobacteraeota bacterium]MBV8722030.1 electron transfer flavoprotein subunit beta/FixA family protein [Candidatus Eremiobacteraeota bacterium]
MKIVVTVKLVPDPNSEKKIDPNTKRLVRTGVETVLNPYDEYALEAALQLKERAGGDATVTVFTMGPEALKETLRKALAMGADEAVMLADAALEGSDVSATSYAMAQALKKTGFDLLIVGGLTDDGSTGAVPGALAEYLGVPCITNARKAEVTGGALQVERETDSGYQTVRGPLPALLTTALTFGEPRYASLKGIMGAKKKPIAILTLSDLGLDRPVGTDGSKTQLVNFAPPPVRGKGKTIEVADATAGAHAIFDFLKEKKLV